MLTKLAHLYTAPSPHLYFRQTPSVPVHMPNSHASTRQPVISTALPYISHIVYATNNKESNGNLQYLGPPRACLPAPPVHCISVASLLHRVPTNSPQLPALPLGGWAASDNILALSLQIYYTTWGQKPTT